MTQPTSRTEEDEAQSCLRVLRDGTPDAKIAARERLAAIFEQRGLFAEAVEAYELNLQAGVRSVALFERLSTAYRRIGDHASAEAAAAEARRVRTAANAPAAPTESAGAAPTAAGPPAGTPVDAATPGEVIAPSAAPPGEVIAPSATSSAKSPAASDASPEAPGASRAASGASPEAPSASRAASDALPTAPARAQIGAASTAPAVGRPAAAAGPAAAGADPPPARPHDLGPAGGIGDGPPPARPRDLDLSGSIGDGPDDDGPDSPAARQADRDRDRWLGLGPVRAASAEAAVAPTARLPAQWRIVEPGAPDEADDDGVAPAEGAAPRPLAVVGAIILLLVVPLVGLALLVVNPLSLYLDGRSAGAIVDARDPSASPPIKVAAGLATDWYVRDGRSVSGLWATSGLTLTFDQEAPGLARSVTVVPPRQQTWGETITIVERRGQGRSSQETIIPASFGAPAALPPVGTILAARISGPVTAPRLSETSQFVTTTQALDLTVQLQVVPWWEAWLDRFVHACELLVVDDRWLQVAVGSLLAWSVLAGAAALVLRARRG